MFGFEVSGEVVRGRTLGPGEELALLSPPAAIDCMLLAVTRGPVPAGAGSEALFAEVDPPLTGPVPPVAELDRIVGTGVTVSKGMPLARVCQGILLTRTEGCGSSCRVVCTCSGSFSSGRSKPGMTQA